MAAIETDTGLTVAVLRKRPASTGLTTDPHHSRRRHGAGRCADRTSPHPHPPASRFRQTPQQARLRQARVHAPNVACAIEQIAHELGLAHRDKLITSALRHDIGRLVLAHLPSGRWEASAPRFVAADALRGLMCE